MRYFSSIPMIHDARPPRRITIIGTGISFAHGAWIRDRIALRKERRKRDTAPTMVLSGFNALTYSGIVAMALGLDLLGATIPERQAGICVVRHVLAVAVH